MSQTFFVAEIFTGTPEKFVEFGNHYSDFDEMLPENLDDIHKAFFYVVKGLTDVKEKAVYSTAATAK